MKGKASWRSNPLLQGRNLIWMMIFGLALVAYTTSLNFQFSRMRFSEYVELSVDLLGNSVSSGVFTRYLLTLQSLAVGVFLLAAGLIFTKRCLQQAENDRMAWLVSLTLLLPVFTFAQIEAYDFGGPWEKVIFQLQGILIFILAWGVVNLLYSFPDGKLVPLWSKRMLYLANGWLFLVFLTSGVVANLGVAWFIAEIQWGITIVLIFIYIGFGFVSQVYRYLRISTTAQRQQTKWVVASLVAQLLWVVTITFPSGSEFPLAERLAALAELHMEILLPTLIPLAFIISILRYNLWDIDVILRRTLLYGSLTFILLAIYLVAVITFQQLFGRMTGETSALGIVLSTLLIAALFTPLRRRLQASIDRRFFRQRYDAQAILDNFSARARDMADLEQIHAEMLQAVWQALQPRHTILWLQESSRINKSVNTKSKEVEE